jgi:hypothetical protein
VIWLANFIAYNKYIGEGYIASPSNHTKVEDGYTFTVKRPGYLGFSGNIAIINADQSVALIIWPSFMCGDMKDYGLMLYDNINDHGYMLNVDADMNYDSSNRTRLLPADELAAVNLLESFKGEAKKQLQMAIVEFGI